jgi:hypothetical protein
MTYTGQDVREGHRLMNEGCENRLVISDGSGPQPVPRVIRQASG